MFINVNVVEKNVITQILKVKIINTNVRGILLGDLMEFKLGIHYLIEYVKKYHMKLKLKLITNNKKLVQLKPGKK